MRITLEIKDQKATAFINFIKSLDFIRINKAEIPETSGKEQIIAELKEAVKELKLVNEGKLKVRPLKELLDEL